MVAYLRWSKGDYIHVRHTMQLMVYVVLEVFCVVYVGKPPTRHTNGMSCWRLCWCMSVNLQHDTPKWYVVLEVFCVVYVSKPPTRHTNGMSWWRYFVLCMSVNLQHDTPMVYRVGGLPTCTTQNTASPPAKL